MFPFLIHNMKIEINIKYIMIGLIIILGYSHSFAQTQRIQHRPYADQRIWGFGFTVGIHAQDLILSHTGKVQPNGEVWHAEIPSYSPGFSVGIIADRYINEYFNIRAVPTLYFGDKKFIFREENTGEEEKTTLKNNYLSLPILVKFSAKRVNNYRPYLLAGVYGNMEIGSKENQIMRLKKMDYGLQFGIGCSIYLPLFKLSPEIRFSLGLKDMIEKNRSDLIDKSLLKYTEALESGKPRMITLTFNFE